MVESKEPMIGRTFGRLTVISEEGRSKNGSITYLCSCSCGKQVVVKGTALRNGNNLSCGCLKKELLSKRSIKNLAGKTINGIKVIEEAGRTNAQKVKWLCVCPECGENFIAIGNSLVSNRVKRCPKCSKKKHAEIITEAIHNKADRYAKEKLIGKKYGSLEIIKRTDKKDKNGKCLYECYCSLCGQTSLFALQNLRRRKTCGCVKPHVKHGLRNHRLYHTWMGMKTRCYNPNSPEYKNYGGRGISICSKWFSDFKVFYDWALSNGYEDALTIERINVNGNYEPSNCTWIPMSEQSNNTRRNNRFTYKGETLNIAQWTKKYNVGRHIIEEGVRNNNLEAAIKKERRKFTKRNITYLYKGEYLSLKEICRKENVKYTLVCDRIYRLNWELERALITPARKLTRK